MPEDKKGRSPWLCRVYWKVDRASCSLRDLGEGKSNKPTGFPPRRGMMFSKDNEQLESFIGSGTEFQGELNVKGIIRVDGHFDGKMNVGSVILSEMGVIKGEVSAKKISIGEKVEVCIYGTELVTMPSYLQFELLPKVLLPPGFNGI
jgi:hypothetical protein